MGLIGLLEFLGGNVDRIIEDALGHLLLVGFGLLFASVVGVTLGILTYRNSYWRTIALSVTGIILTIPSLALFGIFLAFLGLGSRPVILALALYGLLPIVRNTIVGLNGVDPAIVESAQGMGMSRQARLLRIELPLAWPVIVTGVRVSGMMLVAIAAIGAILNAPGFGAPIMRSISRAGAVGATNQAWMGTIGVVAFGIVLDVFFRTLIRITTPRGIR